MSRYKAKFKDESEFFLFGEEYFADKAVFWRSHQTKLVSFSVEVCKKGRPKEIFDMQTSELLHFETPDEFDIWFRRNQSAEIDFGFGELEDETEIIIEAKRRIDEICSFLREEILTLKDENFNPWRIDGGYKFLEQSSKLGICSLENIFSKNSNLNSYDPINDFLNCFKTPLEKTINGETIISYSKKLHAELDIKVLINFCEINLKEIAEILKQINQR